MAAHPLSPIWGWLTPPVALSEGQDGAEQQGGVFPPIREVDRSPNRVMSHHPVDERYKHIFDEWASATAGGILLGLCLGGYKGLQESAHLRNDFGTYKDIRNRNYRVPLNLVHASNQAAGWGWKLGFLTGTFSASRTVLAMSLPAQIATLQASDNEAAKAAGSLLADPMAAGITPTVGSGTLVGMLYGLMSRGPSGAAFGMVLGCGLSVAGGTAQYGLDLAAKRVEAEIEAYEEGGRAKVDDAGGRGGKGDGEGKAKVTKEVLQQRLDSLRRREGETGQDLSADKAHVKTMLKGWQSAGR